MKVKISDLEMNKGVLKITFDYFEKKRTTLLTQRGADYLVKKYKMLPKLEVGAEIEVVRNIQPRRDDAASFVEFFKITKVYGA